MKNRISIKKILFFFGFQLLSGLANAQQDMLALSNSQQHNFDGTNARQYVLTDYGVSTDSTQLNTAAIQRVIDLAAARGGGTVVVPKGVFLSGALFFKPRTTLQLQEGAVLKGSDNIADYPLIPSRMEGRNLLYYAALINAYFVDSFSVTGPGTIDGNGLKFWKSFWNYRDSCKKVGLEATNLDVHRPRLLFIWGCRSVTISNARLQNSGFWTTHLYKCTDVLIKDCRITSPMTPVKAPSTDGVDIDACKRVTIRGCYIAVNDDAVCIKGGKGPEAHQTDQNGMVEDVLVENCTFGPSHAALTMGSECIHARNITMRNCRVENDCPILKFKMRPDTYQVYENITVENIIGQCGSVVNLVPWKQFFNLEGSKAKPFGIVRNIRISNVKVTCKSLGEINGNENDQISGFLLKDIEATTETSGLKTDYRQIKTKNIQINGRPYSL